MFTLNKRLLLLTINRSQFLKSLLKNSVLDTGYLKIVTCSVLRRTKKNNLSLLFTPLHVEPEVDETNTGLELTGAIDKLKLVKIINVFYRKHETKVLAEENGVDEYLLKKAFAGFRKYCLETQKLPAELHIIFSDILKGAGNHLDIFPYFLKYVRQMFPHLECMEDLKKIGDLRTPAKWYQETRNLHRKIIFHCGPTNSGKTYHALQSFIHSKSGIYCGPLKLLAAEVFNKTNKEGTPCDLITGEEIIYVRPDGDYSKHVSCTVEMCSVENNYDVAVIDEIQMIKDPQRGWAWTRALLGIKAKEIHLCGEETVFDLIDSILCTTNEEIEVKKYNRLTNLTIVQPVLSFQNIQPGDCIVCFNKNDIYNVTRSLEKIGKETAVIYGALPPGTKLAQCKKFNDPEDPCNVLVATDAIGMGLNLSIKRVVFYSIMKPSLNEQGVMETVPISVSQALQIAGRAGRYGSRYSEGFVTTFKSKDLPMLKELLSKTPEPGLAAGLLPTIDQIELYSYYLPNSTLSQLVEIFISLSTVDDSIYFICDLKDFLYLAEMLEHVSLPLRVKYTFCCAPINKKLQFTCSMFLKFAKLYSENNAISFNWLCKTIQWPLQTPKTIKELLQLEEFHNVLDLYLWLSYRFPDYFPDGDLVKQIQQELDLIIQEGVINLTKLLINSVKEGSDRIAKKGSRRRSLKDSQSQDIEDLLKALELEPMKDISKDLIQEK